MFTDFCLWIILTRFEQVDGLDKIYFADCHHHIDGVEVFLTIKAPGQIGSVIDGGIELGAQRTTEAQRAAVDLGRHLQQFCDHGGDGNVISHAE